jgi:hypothetical protein
MSLQHHILDEVQTAEGHWDNAQIGKSLHCCMLQKLHGMAFAKKMPK